MNRRLASLLDRHGWSHTTPPTAQQMLRLLAILVLMPGALLVLSGAFALDSAQLAIGVLASVAGVHLLTRPYPTNG